MQCPCIVHTSSMDITGNLINVLNEHNHPGSTSNILKVKAVNKIKKRSRRSNQLSSNIVAEAVANLPENIVARMPRIQSLVRMVQRHREVNRPQVQNPDSRELLLLPEWYSVTAKDESFILYNDGGTDRMIIFTTRKNLDVIKTCKVICGDGTFASVPSIFEQLYTLHGFVGGKCLPLVYPLMPNLEYQLAQLACGQNIAAKKRRAFVEHDVRIKNIVQSFNELDIEHYLMAIANNLVFLIVI
ncbi:hypothetical protein HCN44_005955 [Aphidius gifuensis]|uniref:Uncharacterized protein n=1 Tax=Aphidius gifuensis TaxID=684658 RepID=A0A834XXG1_APHGI|nr:hypothetical protein HCN44_005955 [Aphidius gifuensis]